MSTDQIRFDDGAAYERYMSPWSRSAGATFLDWLAPAAGIRWLDVGCGTGAFTDLLLDRCAPAAVDGIDPAAAQVAHARERLGARGARFHVGDAMALPFAPATFDAAVMPLVLFFVPDPARGVAEMARVVRPGGTVAAYAWDMPGGGFPYAAVQETLRAAGRPVPMPPVPDASRLDRMAALWAEAGLEAVETRAIAVTRTYADFADYWATAAMGPSVARPLAGLPPDAVGAFAEALRARLPAPDADGRLTVHARAHAVTGRVR